MFLFMYNYCNDDHCQSYCHVTFSHAPFSVGSTSWERKYCSHFDCFMGCNCVYPQTDLSWYIQYMYLHSCIQ